MWSLLRVAKVITDEISAGRRITFFWFCFSHFFLEKFLFSFGAAFLFSSTPTLGHLLNLYSLSNKPKRKFYTYNLCFLRAYFFYLRPHILCGRVVWGKLMAYFLALGRLAPYLERRWRRLATPAVSKVPRTM